MVADKNQKNERKEKAEMGKWVLVGLLALTSLLSVVVAVSLIVVVANQGPIFIGMLKDYPPLYTPPTEIAGCYVYDACLMEEPCFKERIFFEKGWSGQSHEVYTLKVDSRGIPTIKRVYALRESFGMGCPENQQHN